VSICPGRLRWLLRAVLIGTLKETCSGRTVEIVEELRQALLIFREIYNTTWLIEGHRFLASTRFRQKQRQTADIAA
jgi:putative transposase